MWAGMNLAHLHRRGLGYGSSACGAQLERLVLAGVNAVALTPFAYQGDLEGHELKWGESLDDSLTDADLVACIKQAHALGIQVCLKPHIWSRSFWSGGKSRQDLAPKNVAAWHAAYGAYILHLAKLAEENQVALLCLGLEYLQLAKDPQGHWKTLAAKVRQVYSGKLTYAANWWREYQEFSAWDSMDLIGINAYFPLSEEEDPSEEQLLAGWQPHIQEILAVTQGRPFLLTELGLRACKGAAAKPWDHGLKGARDDALQARYYQAVLRAFEGQPGYQGLLFWKWFTDDERGEPDPYSPTGREAEQVLARHWGRGAEVGVLEKEGDG